MPYRTGEKAFTKTEVEKMLSHCISTEEEAMIRLAITTGLRRLDLSKVRFENLDLEGRALTFTEHKKGQRIRKIPIPRSTAQALLKHKNALGPAGVRAQEGYLFAWGKSKHGDRTAHRKLQEICDRAGIPRRPFHSLRGTMIKLSQAAGFPPEAVAKITGDTLRVIQEHYLVPSDAELAQVVNERELI